jgi:hypothetical protein
MNDVAAALHLLADRLPSEASWEDVCYEVELLASINRGLLQAKTQRGFTSEALMSALALVE